MKSTTLAQMINGRRVHTIGPCETIRHACITMTSLNVGALPVVEEGGALLGMLSERDVIQRSVIVYRPSESTKVRNIMTPNPKWLPPEANPEDALQIMIRGGFRHLPICSQGRVTGIVSIRDFSPKAGTMFDWLRGKGGKPSGARA